MDWENAVDFLLDCAREAMHQEGCNCEVEFPDAQFKEDEHGTFWLTSRIIHADSCPYAWQLVAMFN